MTIQALEALVETLNFIKIWLKLLDKNHDDNGVSYITPLKQMFKQIPTTITKQLSPKQKSRNL